MRGRRLGLILAFAFALLPLCGGWAGDAKTKNAHFTGKVVPLDKLLKGTDFKLDADAVPHFLVLQSDDGKVYSLLKDAGSRMFFLDAKLLDRPMRLTARPIPNTQMLQVINVHSLVKGKLHEVYYWCDICTIRAYQGGICDCCGEPMHFREVAVKE
jgi:hypothetical protein